MITILAYDGSFQGFLTTVFTVYEEHLEKVTIVPRQKAVNTFFDTVEEVITDHQKAKRVWRGISKYCSSEGKSSIFKAFLSEQEGIEDLLLHFIRRTLKEQKALEKEYSDFQILKISKIVKMVGREKHRMDAFVRFRETKDKLYVATVAPDFNVLPLLVKHFKSRYADQQWIIYDTKRSYGIFYDLNTVSEIFLEDVTSLSFLANNSLYFTENEHTFETLWKNYFNSTNITSRKNTKLHLQHVPKRYWKYLSEKSPI